MKAVLYFPEYTFDISDLNEDMEQSSAVNPVEADADFHIGVSSKSELKFSLNNLYRLISENSLAGKEFLLQRGKPTEYNNAFGVYKKIRKPLFVQHGGFTFAASDRKPYLSVYDNNLVFQDAPEQPPQPVKSLFVVVNKLYCVHDKEPYLTAYSVSGGVLAIQPQVTLTDFYKNKLLVYAKNGRCFNKQGNTVTEYVFIYTDMKVSDVIAETWEYKNFGYYTATKAEKINDTKISVTSYDRMEKFEVLADEFLDSVTYPIPLGRFFGQLCDYVSVPYLSAELINQMYMVPRNFKTDGVTCRQVLQWIAQISCNFVMIDFNGAVDMRWYEEADSPINPKNSTAIDIADYTVKPIDKVQAKAFETDIGVIVPIGESNKNTYVIENNLLLYATSDAQIRPAITNIYNAIKGFSYVPFTAKVRVVNENVKAGMIIPATTVKGTSFRAYVMQSALKGVTGLYAEYGATGNEHRKAKVDAVNQRIEMLNGRTNEIISTIDEFSVTLDEAKDTGEQNTAQLLVQADQIASEVKRATAAEGQLSSKITQTAESITAEVIRATAAEGNLSSRVTQNANEISSKVSKTDYNGNAIASLINQTSTTIDIQANKINLTGYVTLTNLQTAGQTTVNGSNITTGTIDANKAKITNISASNITSGTMSADKISGGTIDANRITVSNINASNITSGSIDASRVTVKNISASNITSGTMSADKISGGTITGVEVYSVSGSKSVRLGNGQVAFGTGAYIVGEWSTLYISSANSVKIRIGSTDFITVASSQIRAHYPITSSSLIEASAFKANGRLGISGSFFVDNKVLQVVGGLVVNFG